MILRALPHTPGHDGVQALPARIRVLALWEVWARRLLVERLGGWAKVAIAAALAGRGDQHRRHDARAAFVLQPDCGRASRGDKLGMEPTYYWDALSPEARRWLAEHTLPGQTFAFRGGTTSWLYLRRTGELPRQLARSMAGCRNGWWFRTGRERFRTPTGLWSQRAALRTPSRSSASP